MARGDIQITLRPGKLAFLEKRGARSRRGHDEWNRGKVLDRLLETIRSVLERYHPVKRKRLPHEYLDQVIALLREPWRLKTMEIDQLENFLRDLPNFYSVLGKAGVDPDKFFQAIHALEFIEKVVLVDLAIQEHAPAAAAAHPEEP